MDEVGFNAFRFGLPGNLVPVRKEDYVFHNWAGAREIGEPFNDDGRDAFQIYENGGATACYAYFTVKALYKLGRVEDARRIFQPMLTLRRGEFQGFCADGKSRTGATGRAAATATRACCATATWPSCVRWTKRRRADCARG